MNKHSKDNNCPNDIEVKGLIEVTKQLSSKLTREEFDKIIHIYYNANKRLAKQELL